jgi:diguanylate cyclase (GGDEF)-like protein
MGTLGALWEDDEVELLLTRAIEATQDRRAQAAPSASSVRSPSLLVVGLETELDLLESLRGRSSVCHETTLHAASERLGAGDVDAVATELFLPDACGLDAVMQLNRSHPQVPVLLIGDELPGVLVRQALAAGAQDVVTREQLERGELDRTLSFAIQRQRSQASMHHEALHDELTRLAKRTLLQQRMANALARSRRMGNTFAVIYVDLDHFKWINDTHGHHVGDAVLVAVSERLRSAVRDYDTVARLGGDEFAILLDTLDDSDEAERVAQRVLASLAQPIEMARRELRVTASIGVSVFPDGGSEGADLLRHADQAMYCAKRAGRNTYSLTPTVEDSALIRRGSLRPSSLHCSAGR